MRTGEERNPRSTAKIFGIPLHAALVAYPITCFVGAWVTDIIYAQTSYLLWQYFSIWLLTAGLIMGGLAALTGLIDWFGDRSIRRMAAAKWHLALNLAAWTVELLNAFVHSRDGWTAVVPDGIILSTLAVLLLLVSAVLGHALVYRHRVGVSE